MIISRTPYRISFFGGGTDCPAWYHHEAGAVLSATIDKYCYISCRFLPPFFSEKHRIVWSHIETVTTVSEILHPAVREGLRFLGFNDSVGLIRALTALQGRLMYKHELALKALEL